MSRPCVASRRPRRRRFIRRGSGPWPGARLSSESFSRDADLRFFELEVPECGLENVSLDFDALTPARSLADLGE